MEPVEIVVHTEYCTARLAEFPAFVSAFLDLMAESGLIGPEAIWDVYPTDFSVSELIARRGWV